MLAQINARSTKQATFDLVVMAYSVADLSRHDRLLDCAVVYCSYHLVHSINYHNCTKSRFNALLVVVVVVVFSHPDGAPIGALVPMRPPRAGVNRAAAEKVN